MDQIREGRYAPAPVKQVWIPKPDGSKRPLGIPTVLDRVIQQAIAQVLGPLFDVEFSESSFGFSKKSGNGTDGYAGGSGSASRLRPSGYAEPRLEGLEGAA